MKIDIIEDYLERNTEHKYILIIELIVDAVRTFPSYKLDDTDDYFNEIKKIMKADDFNLESLKFYVEKNSTFNEEKSIWITDSLNSLIEAFELMQIYKVSFVEVKNTLAAMK